MRTAMETTCGACAFRGPRGMFLKKQLTRIWLSNGKEYAYVYGKKTEPEGCRHGGEMKDE